MEMLRNYYYSDHTSASLSNLWITDNTGEEWVDQRNSTWNAPYTFSGKEKDSETGYGYFGARYYDSGLSIWLSVDPMSDKYPSMSPYNYCANNPVMLVDPDGMEIDGPDDPVIINTNQTKTFSVIQTPTQSSVTELSSETTITTTATEIEAVTILDVPGLKIENILTTTSGEAGMVNVDVSYTTDYRGIKILADGSVQFLNGSFRVNFDENSLPFNGGGLSIAGLNVDCGSKINGPSSSYFYLTITTNINDKSPLQQAGGYNVEMSPPVLLGSIALVAACVYAPQLIPIIAGTVVVSPK